MKNYMLLLAVIATFSACSVFKPNPSETAKRLEVLQSKWVLVSIDDETYRAEDLGSYLPTFELDSLGERVLGTAGCNRYSGAVTVEGNQLTFGPLMSTKMACPQLELEQKFMNLLSEKTVSFRMKGNALVLESGDSRLVFRLGEKG